MTRSPSTKTHTSLLAGRCTPGLASLSFASATCTFVMRSSVLDLFSRRLLLDRQVKQPDDGEFPRHEDCSADVEADRTVPGQRARPEDEYRTCEQFGDDHPDRHVRQPFGQYVVLVEEDRERQHHVLCAEAPQGPDERQ